MKRAVFAVALLSAAAPGCDERIVDSGPPSASLDTRLRQNFAQWGVVPIGAMPNQDAALVALGRALFFDKILSGNKDISCASCHQPGAALGDGLALAVGTGGTGSGSSRVPGSGRNFVARQSPSLINSGLGLFYVFWDGRFTRFGPQPPISQIPPLPTDQNVLIGQAMLTVLERREMRGVIGDQDVLGNPNELALIPDGQATAVWQAIMQRLLAIPEYVSLFTAAFPARASNQLTFQDAARALAVFQMQAFTKSNSPFDRYLNRDDNALTTEQKRGALLFFEKAQCGSCHNGPFLGGQSFSNVGAPQIGPGGSRQPPLDLGRGELDNNSFYRFVFRVAPLRNVELTAPYMHSGAYATLAAVIDHYDNVPQALRTYDVSQLSPGLRSQVHNDDATINAVLTTLDGRVRQPLNLSDDEKRELIAYLRSLTDPAARDFSALAPQRVPSGLPVSP